MDTDIDFAIASANLMRTGVRASKHRHESTTLSKHDAIEVTIKYRLEYVAVLEHKHKPETDRVIGPRYQNNEQRLTLEREVDII